MRLLGACIALAAVCLAMPFSAFAQQFRARDYVRPLTRETLAAAQQIPTPGVNQPEAPKLATKRPVFILTAVTIAAAIMDVEATKHCIKIGTCYEANAFMPQSRLGQYAAKGGFIVGTTFTGFGLRRLPKGMWMRKIWWLPQAANTGFSLYGFSTGMRYRHRQEP